MDVWGPFFVSQYSVNACLECCRCRHSRVLDAFTRVGGDDRFAVLCQAANCQHADVPEKDAVALQVCIFIAFFIIVFFVSSNIFLDFRIAFFLPFFQSSVFVS